MPVWSRILLTVSHNWVEFKSSLRHVRRLQVPWDLVMFFSKYYSFLHFSKLASCGGLRGNLVL